MVVIAVILWVGFVTKVQALSPGAAAAAAQEADSDDDGLGDACEIAFGLDPQSAAGDDGAAGDPDGDGQSNLVECTAGTHPRAFYTRLFAEGANNTFFHAWFALANPDASKDAHVLVTFQGEQGVRITKTLVVPARSSRTVDANDVPGLPATFSTQVESDIEVAADRTMTWDGRGYGSHTETAVSGPSRVWYLAEGATTDTPNGGFSVFYLLQNPGTAEAHVQVQYLRPSPLAPIAKPYTVPAGSRFTIGVDNEDPGLKATEVSAVITSDVPIVAERAMYWSTAAQLFAAGHDSVGVTEPRPTWFLAEGATGSLFELFILIANPTEQDAVVRATYLLDDGSNVIKTYDVSALSRRTVLVDAEDPRLRTASVSARLESLTGVPIIVERTMWWPDGNWQEAHNSAGATATGTRWLLAEGEAAGPLRTDTFILIANTSPYAAQAEVQLLYEDGPGVAKTFTLAATSRFSVNVAQEFPEARGRRFGALVTSVGTRLGELVVERSVYQSPGTVAWEAGTNALGTNLSPAVTPLPDMAVFETSGPVTVDAKRHAPDSADATFAVATSGAAVGTATIDPATGLLTLTPNGAAGSMTVTVTSTSPRHGTTSESFTFTTRALTPVTFDTPVFFTAPLYPAVWDFNHDGFPEMAGTTLNDGHGHLTQQDLRAVGLGVILDINESGLAHRCNLVADFNGDGLGDIVSHSYTNPHVDPVNPPARLFINNGDQTYHEDPDFTAMGIIGNGETIHAADYNNDGYLDLLVPQYTWYEGGHFRLLINDGHGKFTDIADEAGVANRNWPYERKVEGTQAVDFNDDGWLDFYAASHLYISNGIVNGKLTFTDRAVALNLPDVFDEGVKFLDWNNDGLLDIARQDFVTGPHLWEFDGVRFHQRDVIPPVQFVQGFGFNVWDINNDGYEDLLAAPGSATPGSPTVLTRIYLNNGTGFQLNPSTSLDGVGGDIHAFGDFNGDGRIDVGRRIGGVLGYALNTTVTPGSHTLTIEVLDEQGRRNQQGRVVRVTPIRQPGVTYTRVVDSGSGYLAENQYPLLIGTPYTGAFRVVVRYSDRRVEFEMHADERKRVYRDGRVEDF